MKKALSFVLMMALVLSVCGAFAAETREELLAENVTLTLMTKESYYAGVSIADDLPVFRAMEEAQNVTLKYELAPSSQFGTVLQTRLAAAVDLPDMIIDAGIDASVYGASGILISLEGYINEINTPNYLKMIEEVPLLGAVSVSPDGHQYGLPCYGGKGEMRGGGRSIALRGDWLENLGLEVPTTTDELFNVLVAFRDQDANGNGDPSDEIPFADGYDKLNALASAFNANWGFTDWNVDDEGNVYYIRASEGYREFLRFANKLYEENLLDPEFATTDDDQVEAKEPLDIIGGRFYLWINELPFSESLIHTANEDGYYVVLDPLTGPDGTQGYINARSLCSGKYCITKDCQYPERAISFIDYILYDDDAVMLENAGEQGVCWDYDENGEFYFTDYVMNNPDGLSAMNAIRSTGGYWTMWLTPTYQCRKAMNAVDDRYVEYIDSIAQYVKFPAAFGIPTEEETLRINELARDIQTVTSENLLLFITGDMDVDEDWDGYIETLESLGLSEYTKLYQATYDRVNAGIDSAFSVDTRFDK